MLGLGRDIMVVQCLLNSGLFAPLAFHTIRFIIGLFDRVEGTPTTCFTLSLWGGLGCIRFTLIINLKGDNEVANIPLVRKLERLISRVDFVSSRGHKMVNI